MFTLSVIQWGKKKVLRDFKNPNNSIFQQHTIDNISVDKTFTYYIGHKSS